MPEAKAKRILMCAPYIRANDRMAAADQYNIVRRCIERRFTDGWIPSLPAYEDIGHSGFARSPGPALQRLLSDAEAGQFDIVVVARPNRLSRRFWLLYKIFEKLESNGVSIYSATQGAPLLELVPREQMRRTAEFFKAVERDYESGKRPWTNP
jgi:DNA invertase Pin-like site-specific DNA recombinase